MDNPKPKKPTPEQAPLAHWDDARSEHPNLVWWSRLDGRYQVEVQRRTRSSGTLCVFERLGALARAWPVTLTFGARFGPDIEDVWRWQRMAEAFSDRGSRAT